MKKIIKKIKRILKKGVKEKGCEEELIIEQEKKFANFLETVARDNDESIKEINDFLSSDEIKKRKVLFYFTNFIDDTLPTQTIIENGEQIQQQDFAYNKLEKRKRFLDRRKIIVSNEKDVFYKIDKSGTRIQEHKFLGEDELEKLKRFIKEHEKDLSFGETVYKIMDNHKMTAPQVYKGAMLARQDFSRVIHPETKNVTKQLAWQMIVGLRCNLAEADQVLFSAGYIRRKNKFDLMMEYFIQDKNYDIMAINVALYDLGLKVFSCYKPVLDRDNK